MDKKVIEILNIYDDCGKVPSCEKCKASKFIEGTETSWCEFLREHDRRLYDKIDRVFTI